MTADQASKGMNGSFVAYFARKPAPARVGVFAVGLHTYWPQFAGLKDELMVHHQKFVEMLRATGVTVFDAGMSDTSRDTFRIAEELAVQQVDLLFCNVVTYSPSAHALPVVQRVGRPLVLAALQPQAKLDYAKATTHMQLLNDNVTSLPEISNALVRANLQPADAIVGQLYGDARAAERVAEWCDIARVLHILRRARVGLIGHVYEGMLDMNSDPTMFDAKFGLHAQHIELDVLHECVQGVGEKQVAEHLALLRELFHFAEPGSDPLAGPVDAKELEWAARVSLGMERLVQNHELDALAYYYSGSAGNENERLGSNLIIGSSLLTGRGVPVAGEYDLKNCVAMLIMDRLRAGGSFAELHPVDFDGDFVLVGHDGPHHIGIAQGRPILRGLSVLHGKRGRGPSVEFAIKHGPITLLGLTQTFDGRIKFVLAEGESLPGMIPATGNTNTRGKFSPNVRTFLERWSLEGPTHHFALGVGHQGDKLAKLARVLDIPCVNVTRM